MFHNILFTGYLVKVNVWILNHIKGNKSCTIDASLTKLNDHCCVMKIQNVVSFINSIDWLLNYYQIC